MLLPSLAAFTSPGMVLKELLPCLVASDMLLPSLAVFTLSGSVLEELLLYLAASDTLPLSLAAFMLVGSVLEEPGAAEPLGRDCKSRPSPACPG